MGKFDKYHNAKILEQGLEAFLKKDAPKFMVENLVKVAKEVKKDINAAAADGSIPVYTGNLRNSIGTMVLHGSQKVYISPCETSTNPPHVQSAGAAATGEYGVPMYNIIGAEYFQKEIELARGMLRGSDAYQLIVFASVPYAAYINEYGSKLGRGQAFFNKLVGWNLVGKLGRVFFKGNKKFIDEAYRLVQ